MSGSGSTTTWRCGTCDEPHTGPASTFGVSWPDAFSDASDETLARSEINADTAALATDDGMRWFVRGHVVLPVHGADDPDVFVWSVWAELADEAIAEVAARWQDPDRASQPPVPVRLDARPLPYDRPATGLTGLLHDREPGPAPRIVLDPAQDHPLVAEQRDGITRQRVLELNELLLHPR